jgi:hypothetical protein
MEKIIVNCGCVENIYRLKNKEVRARKQFVGGNTLKSKKTPRKKNLNMKNILFM